MGAQCLVPSMPALARVGVAAGNGTWQRCWGVWSLAGPLHTTSIAQGSILLPACRRDTVPLLPMAVWWGTKPADEVSDPSRRPPPPPVKSAWEFPEEVFWFFHWKIQAVSPSLTCLGTALKWRMLRARSSPCCSVTAWRRGPVWHSVPVCHTVTGWKAPARQLESEVAVMGTERGPHELWGAAKAQLILAQHAQLHGRTDTKTEPGLTCASVCRHSIWCRNPALSLEGGNKRVPVLGLAAPQRGHTLSYKPRLDEAQAQALMPDSHPEMPQDQPCLGNCSTSLLSSPAKEKQQEKHLTSPLALCRCSVLRAEHGDGPQVFQFVPLSCSYPTHPVPLAACV